MQINLFEDNQVTMTLADFLVLFEAYELMRDIRDIAIKSRKTYGNKNERDAYEIGHEVLVKMEIPFEAEDEKDSKEESANV